MTVTFTATRGLPASGKTTWALARLGPDVWRVNRDDLRRMGQGVPRYDEDSEAAVTVVQKGMIRRLLHSGISVICDDTNLNPTYLNDLLGVAEHHGAETLIEDFTHVPLETCLHRDRLREQPVGDAVIMAMHARWLT